MGIRASFGSAGRAGEVRPLYFRRDIFTGRTCARVKLTLYTGRSAALKTKSSRRAKNEDGHFRRGRRFQLEACAGARVARGRCVTVSRIDFSDIPLRTSAANPRKANGIVSAKSARNEKLVALFLST